MAVGTAPPPTAAVLPCDRRLMERIESERLAVRALLKKAEALVARRKNRNGGAAKATVAAHAESRALSRRGKKTTRPEATAATDGAASPKKRRKMGPMVEVGVEVIDPTMPMAQRDRLYGLLSSLSAEMPLPLHILGFMQSQCCCFVCPDSDEMDVDLRSTKDAVLFKLLNLLEEFAQQQSKIQRLQEQEPPKIEAVDSSDAISRSSICQLEEGEIVDDMDICGGVSPLVVVDQVQFSPLPKQQEDDELIDICGGVSPVSVNKFPETSRSPSSSSSSDSSSSSSSGATSGSSCSSSSSSSDSDSDSDSDEDTASSSPEDTSGLPIEAEAKPLLEEQQQVTEQHKELITERAACPDTQMQELIARAQEKQKLQHRKRAREQLEEMKRTAQPVYESINPALMKQLGISKEVEYMVSPVFCRDSARRRGGGLLQKLGFFLKE